MGCRGGGGSIYYGIIYCPSLPTNIQERFFVNGIQWQLSFNTQKIYISQTILIHGWHFFWWDGGGGGVNILWYNILTPPPPSKKIFKNSFCTWNPVTTKLQYTKHLHITDNTNPWLKFLFYGMGGVNILWYNILTAPPPPQWYKGKTTLKQNPITALLYHFDHLSIFGDTISM